jgi:hypothetical protein
VSTTSAAGAQPRAGTVEAVRHHRWHLAAVASCLAAAMALWLISLPAIHPAAMDDLGLVSVLPWSFWAAIVLLVAGFCMSLARGIERGPLPFLFLANLVLVLHATPAITYVTLRYSWAWKHLGVVDYYLRHGTFDPEASFLAAYHNWPGFFMASALFAKLYDADPLVLSEVARFFPPILNLLYIALLPMIFRRFSSDDRLIWAGVAMFVVGNWVGQDYFSPQGSAFLLYLGVLALCLGPLATDPRNQLESSFAPARLVARFGMWANRNVPAPPPVGPVARIASVGGVIALIAALTVTHQLTPILLIVALAGLVVIGRLNGAFVILAALMEVLWLFYFAQSFIASAFSSLVAEFGTLSSDTVGRMVDLAQVSAGQQLVVLASRILTATIAVAAVLGGLRRLRHGYWDAPAVVLTLAPLPLLASTSYGGEILFRLYFFALPFLAFFAAALFFPTSGKAAAFVPRLALAVLLLLLVPGFLLANNGKDRQYWFTPQEVQAADWLYRTAPPGSLLIEGSRNYPSQFRNYENFVYVPISEERPQARAEILDAPAAVLGRWLSGAENGGFVIITRSQKRLLDDLGLMPGALADIERALLASAAFRVVHATEHTTIFTLNDAAPAAIEALGSD